jgi:hypothetical protein
MVILNKEFAVQTSFARRPYFKCRHLQCHDRAVIRSPFGEVGRPDNPLSDTFFDYRKYGSRRVMVWHVWSSPIKYCLLSGATAATR